MQLLFFHANYCPPCKAMQLVAKKYSEESVVPLFTFRADDIYSGHAMARTHHVKHLPCLILLDSNGNEITRTETLHTIETLHAIFDKYLCKGDKK